MVRLLILISMVVFYGPCAKNRPNPQPFPTPVPTIQPTPEPTLVPTPEPTATPIASPSPSPVAAATPYPTPKIDPASYLPPVQTGKIVIILGEHLAEKIQAAQNDPEVATVRIEGGGSIAKQVTLRKHTIFDSSTYSCDVQGITDSGVFLIADGVLVEGTWRPPQELLDYFKSGNGRDYKDPYLLKVQALTPEQLAGTGTTILEPTYVADWAPLPAIEVFQTLGDSCCSHSDKAENIAVVGFHIKGRQRIYDGGVRSTILFGNCHHCLAQNNYLEDTASIGITFGGSALEFTRADGVKLTNNFANDVVISRNVFSGVAAANSATINSENAYVLENYVRRPGHHDPVFGGGVCGHDHETNSEADHTRNIFVYNNLYDYESAMIGSAGSAVCLQDPYESANRGKVVAANNVMIGGRDDRNWRYMTNGLFLNGLKGCEIVNNYVYRTGQNAIQIYSLDSCLIQDNDFESTGGGGNATVVSNQMKNTVLRRNNYRERQGLGINTQAGFIDRCGEGNVYEENRVLGEIVPVVSRVCP